MRFKILLFSLVVSALSFTAAALDFTVDRLNYQLISASEQTCRLMPGDYTGAVVVPSTVQYGGRDLKVIEMAEYTFYSRNNPSCKEITSISLGQNLKVIPNYCFYQLPKVEEITLPASLEKIGYNCFIQMTNVKRLVLESYPDYTQNTTLVMGDRGDKMYNDNPFERFTGLETLVFKRPVKLYVYKGKGVFEGLTSLRSVEFGHGVALSGFKGCTSLTTITGFEYFPYFYKNAFENCPLEGSIINCRYIRDNALRGNHLSSITFDPSPETGYEGNIYNVVEIGEGALASSQNLTSLVFPKSVAYIAKSAIYGCPNLKSITIEGNADLKQACFAGNDYDIVTFKADCHQNSIALAFNYTSGVYVYTSTAKELHINAVEPPEQFTDFYGTTYEFPEDWYVQTILYVPQQSLELYKAAPVWKNFWNIKGEEVGGVNDVNVDPNAAEQVYYDLQGRVVVSPTNGIYIKKQGSSVSKIAIGK